MELSELVNKMIKHDWFYPYSDSMDTWRAGTKEEDMIILELIKLNHKEIEFMINGYVPYMFRDNYRNLIKLNKEKQNA